MPSWSERVRSESRDHLKLALPLCLGHVGHQLMALVDSAMVGHYDRTALAGFGVANGLLMTLTFLGVGIVLGLDSVIPKAIGAGEPSKARAYFRSGVSLAVMVGLPLTLVGAISPGLMPLVGVAPDVAAEAEIYLYGRLPAILPYLVYTAHSSYLQACGFTRPIVLTVVAGNLINLCSDSLLVFGDGALEYLGLPGVGLPALGGLGASISTSIVSTMMMLGLILAVRRQGEHVNAKGSSAMRKSIASYGLPVGLQLLAEVGIFALVGMLAGRMGALPSAAHQISLTIASASFSLAVGMGAATAVRVGHAVGAEDHEQARRAGVTGASWGAGLLALAGLVYLLWPLGLAGLFTGDQEVVQACVPLLAIAAVFQLSDAVQAIMAGALRGVGDTRASFVGNLLGHYGVGIWVALLLAFPLDMGAAGLWWGLSAGLTAVAIGLFARFWRVTKGPISVG